MIHLFIRKIIFLFKFRTIVIVFPQQNYLKGIALLSSNLGISSVSNSGDYASCYPGVGLSAISG